MSAETEIGIGVVGGVFSIIGYFIKRTFSDIKRIEDKQARHEIDAAEKYGVLSANVKTLTESLPRIHERLDDLVNFLMKKP